MPENVMTDIDAYEIIHLRSIQGAHSTLGRPLDAGESRCGLPRHR